MLATVSSRFLVGIHQHFITSFIWRPTRIPSFIFASLIQRNFCTRYRKRFAVLFMAFTECTISPSLMWSGDRNIFCGSTSESFTTFFHRETFYDEAILSQRSDELLHDSPIHIRRIKIAYNQSACRAEDLRLSDLHRYSKSTCYIICIWAEVSYVRMTLLCAQHGQEGLMVNRFHYEGQPSDLSLKNQCAIANPRAYVHVLMPSSVHQLFCSRICHHLRKMNFQIILTVTTNGAICVF
jgi:hypothetical protein